MLCAIALAPHSSGVRFFWERNLFQRIKLKQIQEDDLQKDILNSDGGILKTCVQFSMGLDKAFAKMNSKSKSDLTILISNKLAIAKPAYERRENIFGKLFNKLLVEDPEYIQLSGIELFAIAKLILEKIEIPIYESKQYLVPYRDAEKMLYKLKDK